MATASQSDADLDRDDSVSKAGPSGNDSTPETDPLSETDSNGGESAPETDADGERSTSMADRLATAAKVLWVAFLGGVVVFTLIPVAGVLAGVTPFPAPDPIPYYALVGLALAGTVALVGAAIYDV